LFSSTKISQDCRSFEDQEDEREDVFCHHCWCILLHLSGSEWAQQKFAPELRGNAFVSCAALASERLKNERLFLANAEVAWSLINKIRKLFIKIINKKKTDW